MARSTLLLLVLAAVGATACGNEGALDDVATTEDDLSERPVFTKFPVHSGTAAGWFDTTRGAVFSLARLGTDRPRWVEQKWDGQAWTTTADFTAPNAAATPSYNAYGRDDVATAFDSKSGRLLLLTRTALWSWDGAAFVELPAATLPSLRNGFSAAFDSTRERLVVFGTSMEGYLQTATWEWDGATFTDVSASASPNERPNARHRPQMVFDHERERVVLVGGTSSAGRKWADTWEWDGAAWTKASETIPLADCVATGSTWDASRKRTTLFGPNCGVREWDGTSWTAITMPAAWRGLDYAGQVAYDASRKRTVLWTSGSGTVDLGFSTGANQSPTLEALTSRDVIAGEIMTQRLVAQDPDGAMPTFGATPMPTGSTLTGDLFRWTPGFDQLGPHEVTFAASDGALDAKRTVTFTVVEPVFTPWFPRGLVQMKGTGQTMMGQTDSRTNGGSEQVSGGSAMTVTCKLGGNNPTGLSVTCTGAGSYRRQSDPFSGYSPESVSFTATGRVNGNGNFYASLTMPGTTANVDGKVVSGALEVKNVFLSIGRRFPNGWTGHTTLRSSTPLTLPLTAY
jgi:hypothetical protein